MGFLAYNLRTVGLSYSAQALHSGRYYRSAFLHKTDLRKAAQVLPGKLEKSMTSCLVSLRSISFWLCVRLLRGCKIFVLKFDWEIPRGFGEIKVYTFGIGYFNGRG